jgi:hypothetical protein
MKTLLLILVIFSSSNTYCQVLKFKSFSSSTTIRNKKGEIIHTENHKSDGIVVIINFRDSSVHTHGQAPIDARLFAVVKNYEDKDGNKILVFAAVDRSDTKCVVVFTTYKNPDSIGFEASLDFSWPETDIVFGLKNEGKDSRLPR